MKTRILTPQETQVALISTTGRTSRWADLREQVSKLQVGGAIEVEFDDEKQALSAVSSINSWRQRSGMNFTVRRPRPGVAIFFRSM